MTTTITPPDRSLDQCMEALARANEIRLARANLKRDLKAGRVSASAVIADPPEWAETMTLFKLLLATPRYGHQMVNTALNRTGISPSKTLAGLTDRQREAILRHLGGR